MNKLMVSLGLIAAIISNSYGFSGLKSAIDEYKEYQRSSYITMVDSRKDIKLAEIEADAVVAEYVEPEPVYEEPTYEAYTYLGEWTVTHYCNCEICCGIWAGGNTASGAYPTANHTVATGDLPFGTRLLINGQIYVVEDRGVPGGWVDIYCDSHEEALNRGMYTTSVYLVN